MNGDDNNYPLNRPALSIRGSQSSSTLPLPMHAFSNWLEIGYARCPYLEARFSPSVPDNPQIVAPPVARACCLLLPALLVRVV